ncbi:MAG TPA: MerR family DNA-binding transcriptional regulator [Coleofasciculaceae cyanobacterium]
MTRIEVKALQEQLIKIGELAKQTNVSVSTLGYYESLGLLEPAFRNTQNAPVIALTLLKQGEDNTVMYGCRFLKSALGIYRSNDGGKTWEKLWMETKGVVVKLAIAPNNPQILYAVNENNTVFQSQDSGKSWQKLS